MTETPTTGPRTAGPLARRAIEAGTDLILIVGGDGTINETVQGMAGSSVPLGVLPAGTANVLANEVGIARRPNLAATELSGWTPRLIGLGKLTNSEQRYFLLMAGIGLDAHLVYRVNAAVKSRLGKGAYWLAGAGIIGRPLAEFRLETGQDTLSSTFTLVSRVRNYGGDFRIAPSAALVDDSFEVVVFDERRSTAFVKYLAGMVVNRLAGMRGVRVFRTTQLTMTASADPRVYAQVDGEYAGRLPARIDFVPDALNLLMPAAYGASAMANRRGNGPDPTEAGRPAKVPAEEI